MYGDDFTFDEIRQWYEDEKEGYAELVKNYPKSYHYGYHKVNQLFGYRFLPKRKYKNVLGIGSAYGDEFSPISAMTENVYILEPSDNLKSSKIGETSVVYKKPNINGSIDFPDNYFDLIVCLGTLHHIPNVTYVLSELYRCLNRGGYVLLREPINSMGNWRQKRAGLTKRERGIPYSYFEKILPDLGFKQIKRSLFLP